MNDFIVAILNESTLAPMFPGGIGPMRVTVRETSKLTSWPVEDGTQRTDHRVLDPIEIDFPIIIASDETRNIFEQLRQVYLRGDSLTVQTRMRTYESMMIVEMPHDETPEMSDAVSVSVRMKQVLTVMPEFGTLPASKVANRNQSSTVNKGGQQTSNADTSTQRRASVLYNLTS